MPEPVGVDFSCDVEHLHPYLRERWPQLCDLFQSTTGHDLILTCTWRSVKEQKRLYAQGRKTPGKVITWVDGIKKKSNHNHYPARAFDVAVDINQGMAKAVVSWDDKEYFPLVELCPLLGLVSGGSWKKKDWPHVEMAAGIV